MNTPVHRQTLLLFKGHPATGKSTLANALAQRLHWPLLDKDDIKDQIYQFPKSGHLSYGILWQIVRHQLAIGLSVIVDSTLSYPQSYATAKLLAASCVARVIVVETVLPEVEWKARLDRRLREPRTHRTSGWAAMQHLLAEYNDSWRYPIAAEHHLVVDSSQPVTTLVQQIIDHLHAKA